MEGMRRVGTWLGLAAAVFAGVAVTLWAVGLTIFQPWVVFPVLAAVSMVVLRMRGRRMKRALGGWAAGVIMCAVCYLLMRAPSDSTEWQLPWREAPTFSLEQEGEVLRVHGVRDFSYPKAVYEQERYRKVSAMLPQYREECYPLRELCGVDYADCFWDGHTAVCHTMLSFRFEDGRHLVVSAETRLPQGVEQNALGGIYKKYRMLYVFGTEADIFGLRTDHRHEDLYLFPMRVTREQAREMLLTLVRRQEQAQRDRAPYNTLTDNCSTGVIAALRSTGAVHPGPLAHMLNAGLAERLYCAGLLEHRPGESFAELRRRASCGYDVSPDNRAAYSRALRQRCGVAE